MTVPSPSTEQVVLLDEAGHAVGAAPKQKVHHRHTPLHLAFSCYVFDRHARLLVTRRALTKQTWPGVWTNTACGHPAPGEDIVTSIHRRVGEELGIGLDDVWPVLPTFRYQATMSNGVRENEICPVFAAVTDDEPRPDPDEVDATEWVAWEAFRADVVRGRREVSPWCLAQMQELAAFGTDPLAWTADPAPLPHATSGR